MATHMPKNTPTPMPCRLAEPGPDDNTSGNNPRIKASEVMTIGLKRSFDAVTAAVTASTPLLISTLANSTIKIAFFATRPTSITNPI